MRRGETALFHSAWFEWVSEPTFQTIGHLILELESNFRWIAFLHLSVSLPKAFTRSRSHQPITVEADLLQDWYVGEQQQPVGDTRFLEIITRWSAFSWLPIARCHYRSLRINVMDGSPHVLGLLFGTRTDRAVIMAHAFACVPAKSQLHDTSLNKEAHTFSHS